MSYLYTVFSAGLFRTISIQNALFKMQSVLSTCRFHIHYRSSSVHCFTSFSFHIPAPTSLNIFILKKNVLFRISSPLQKANLKHTSGRRTETAWIHFKMIKLPLLSFPSHWTIRASTTVLLIFLPFWWFSAVENILFK